MLVNRMCQTLDMNSASASQARRTQSTRFKTVRTTQPQNRLTTDIYA